MTIRNFYAPTEASSPDVEDRFWNALYRAKWRTIRRTVNIILCDANGHIGIDHSPPGIGKQGQEPYNVNGHHFADLVTSCSLAIINTLCSLKGASSTTHHDARIDYACLPRTLLGYVDHSKSGVNKHSSICLNIKDHYPVFLWWKELPIVADTRGKKTTKDKRHAVNIDTTRLRSDLRAFAGNQTRAVPKRLERNNIAKMNSVFTNYGKLM
jgi:hypothetical protein